MTIFDSIKYPIGDNDGLYEIKMKVPSEIWDYWYYNYPLNNTGRQHLRRIISKYDTDECEIHSPRIFKSINKALYDDL